MIDWQAVPIFGVPDSRLPHIVRPSAYGLIVGPSDRLAIVRTEIGSYLPGGGILGTESPEAAICREAREECGLTVAPGSWRHAAIDHVTVAREGAHFEKRSTFCDATADDARSEPVEPNHRLSWLSPDEALRVLTSPCHRWAVAEWLAHRPRSTCAGLGFFKHLARPRDAGLPVQQYSGAHVMRVALHRGSASQATPTAMPVSTSATPHMRSKLIHARRTTCSAARSYTITANSAVISR